MRWTRIPRTGRDAAAIRIAGSRINALETEDESETDDERLGGEEETTSSADSRPRARAARAPDSRF
jgi:hypothetical protein